MARRESGGPGGARQGAGRPRKVRDPIRLSVDYERADFKRLKSIARERGTSVAAVIREAVRLYLAKRED